MRSPSPRTTWFVIPCFNEGGLGDYCIKKTFPMFENELKSLIDSGKCSDNSRICYIDDGSRDDTWDSIREFSDSSPYVVGLKLSRNYGHQYALLAGLMEARGNCDLAISMDCDGQDSLSAISEMIDAFNQGYDIVYGVRSSRAADTFFKRTTAEAFYKLMNVLGAEIVFNHADYRMMSLRALDGLAEFRESNLFIRGLVPMIGYPSTTIEYERAPRLAGETHYSMRKMVRLAFDGITSLSVRPIRLITSFGLIVAFVGVMVALWALVSLAFGQTIAGWTSSICLMCILGGAQLVALGVIGEYVGKIYIEVKGRPRWIVAEKTGKYS